MTNRTKIAVASSVALIAAVTVLQIQKDKKPRRVTRIFVETPYNRRAKEFNLSPVYFPGEVAPNGEVVRPGFKLIYAPKNPAQSPCLKLDKGLYVLDPTCEADRERFRIWEPSPRP